MLKPSDFNNAVPQFPNGNYASNPTNPQYVEEPSSTDYNHGTEPLQTLPAQWWNWFMNKFTSRFNKVNIYVKNLFNELAQLLSLVNVTPDGTEGAVTDGQLKNAFKELYPDYINTKLALESTYVKKTQKINNHALSGDVNVTKSDVGLGNVPDVSTNDQTPTYTEASTLTALSSGEKLSIAFGKIAKAVSSLISHINNTSNPHSVTKAQVQLGNVVNTGDSATPVENGTTKFTTGGAYNLKTELEGKIDDVVDVEGNLPTDAVLHYSFDEVPDIPDGTAVYKKDNDFTDSDGWNSDYGNTTFSASNGIAKWTSLNDSTIQLSKAIQNSADKIIKMRIKCSKINLEFRVLGNENNSFKRLATVRTNGNWQDIICYKPSTYNTQIALTLQNNKENTSIEISQIYIGDGSYSTPIIDNANGQNNATNNGGIAVQGVSGKGAYFLNGKYAKINSNFLFTPNFSISLWIKPDNNTNGLQGIILRNGQLLLRNGDTSENYLMFILAGANGPLLKRQNIGNLLPSNVWTNLIIVRNATTFLVYTNGIETYRTTLTDSTISDEVTDFLISQSNLTRPQTLDDLLIFNRALSETEVMALYLNKANTPKYYGEVPVTCKINGHTLEEDITLTKADVGLGSVVDTGDSATPVSGGTTKFTTGGAYNLLTSLAPIFSTSISYAVGDMVTYSGKLYTCTTAHSAGAWNERHFTICNLNTEFQKPANNIIEDFQINKTYMTGQLVIYNKELYKHIGVWGNAYSEWDGTQFQKVQMYANRDNRGTTISRYVLNLSLYGTSQIFSLPALCAGSELVIRLNNDDSNSVTARFDAYHNYTLGVAFSHGGMSNIQKLTSGQSLTITVQADEYLEVTINYLKVDGDGIVNLSMFEYPIPSITKY